MAPQDNDPVTPPQSPNPDSLPQQPSPLASPPPPLTSHTTPDPQQQPFTTPDSQAPSPFTAAPEQATLTPIKPQSNRKKILAIIIATVIVVLGFGGYAAYALWYNNPQNVVADALGKVATMKTSTAKGYVESSNDSSKIRANFDYAQASQREGSVTGDLNVTSGGKTYTLKASFVGDKENKAYIKLENVSKLLDTLTTEMGGSSEYLSMFEGLITKIDNKWVVITPKDLAGGDEKANERFECTTKALETFNDDKKQQDEIFGAYKKNPFIEAKQVGAESINGASSNHYEITLNQQKARDFIKVAKETAIYKALDKCEDGEFSKSYDESSVDDMVSGASKAKIELWVDQWSHNPTKLKMSADESGQKTTFEMTMDLTAKPTVTVPKADTTFDDLTAEIEKIQQEIFGDMSMYDDLEDAEQPVLGAQTFLPSYMTRLLQ